MYINGIRTHVAKFETQEVFVTWLGGALSHSLAVSYLSTDLCSIGKTCRTTFSKIRKIVVSKVSTYVNLTDNQMFILLNLCAML
jgi:hypothetical protein